VVLYKVVKDTAIVHKDIEDSNLTDIINMIMVSLWLQYLLVRGLTLNYIGYLSNEWQSQLVFLAKVIL
jgi:hypothetical protein